MINKNLIEIEVCEELITVEILNYSPAVQAKTNVSYDDSYCEEPAEVGFKIVKPEQCYLYYDDIEEAVIKYLESN